MRKGKDLRKLARSFDRRLVRLETILRTASGRLSAHTDRDVAYVAIEGLSAWANFCREFYLSCALLSPRTASGTRVTHSDVGIFDERSALLRAIALLNQTRFVSASRSHRISAHHEPDWKDKRALLKLSRALSLSNQTSIISGLSYQTTFFDQFPIVRNFYAHRSMSTAHKISTLALPRYGVRRLHHPTDLLTMIIGSRRQTLLEEWLDDLRQIALLASS